MTGHLFSNSPKRWQKHICPLFMLLSSSGKRDVVNIRKFRGKPRSQSTCNLHVNKVYNFMQSKTCPAYMIRFVPFLSRPFSIMVMIVQALNAPSLTLHIRIFIKR